MRTSTTAAPIRMTTDLLPWATGAAGAGGAAGVASEGASAGSGPASTGAGAGSVGTGVGTDGSGVPTEAVGSDGTVSGVGAPGACGAGELGLLSGCMINSSLLLTASVAYR